MVKLNDFPLWVSEKYNELVVEETDMIHPRTGKTLHAITNYIVAQVSKDEQVYAMGTFHGPDGLRFTLIRPNPDQDSEDKFLVLEPMIDPALLATVIELASAIHYLITLGDLVGSKNTPLCFQEYQIGMALSAINFPEPPRFNPRNN